MRVPAYNCEAEACGITIRSSEHCAGIFPVPGTRFLCEFGHRGYRPDRHLQNLVLFIPLSSGLAQLPMIAIAAECHHRTLRLCILP